MNKAFIISGILIVLLIPVLLYNWVIITPSEEQCQVVEITISDVFEGGTLDIVFTDQGKDRFI